MVKDRLPARRTIYNALRVALRIISGKIILNFAFVALCGALQTHFHRWGRKCKLHLQCPLPAEAAALRAEFSLTQMSMHECGHRSTEVCPAARLFP